VTILEAGCRVCASGTEHQLALVVQYRGEGWGYERIWREHNPDGFSLENLRLHCKHVPRTVLTAVGEAEDRGEDVDIDDYFSSHGINMPPEGWNVAAATVEEQDDQGRRHWVRVRPEQAGAERVEVRQAQPVTVKGKWPAPKVWIKTNWRTWIANPDCQIGWWRDHRDVWHTIHDERCFDLGHQVALAVAEAEGVHGWLDVGDFLDLAAPSRHHPTSIDLHVEGLNKATQRGCEELAWRRWLVGPDGESILMGGNHDIRLQKKAAQDMPYLVGLRRPGDPDDEYPILSAPYLVRAREHGVEWCSGYPNVYRPLNSNLVACHAPAYGSRALDTARKIAARVHASVIHGHTHRREALAENIGTVHGTRTLEIWSDGTWARVDGSLPANDSSFDEYWNRVTQDTAPKEQGVLGPNFHQGMSVIHVETEGRERFSVERIAFWDGWAQFRGQSFQARCDVDGTLLDQDMDEGEK
jgi:hypothetical protein